MAEPIIALLAATSLNLPGEEWRPVVGYEGWYEVSNLGRLKRVRDWCSHPGTVTRKAPYILKGSLGYRSYYLTCILSRESVRRSEAVASTISHVWTGRNWKSITS